jgi:type IV pilus assembly protein PilM
MTVPAPLIGIDIGSTAVRLCQLQQSPNGFQLELYDQIDLSQAPAGQKKKSLRVRDAIHELIERNAIDEPLAAITPPVEEEFLRGIRLKRYRHGFKRSEAASELFAELPAIPDAMYLQAIPRPGGAEEDAIVFGAQRDPVHRRIEMLNQIGVQVPIVDGSLFALYNLWDQFFRPYNDARIAIVDIGYRSTRILVVDGKLWQTHGTIHVGGRNLTTQLRNVLDLTHDEAESYKLGGSDTGDGGIIPRDVHEVLVDASNELAAAVRRALDESQADLPEEVIVSGRTSSLQLVRQALADHCGVQTRRIEPFQHIHVPEGEFSSAFVHRIGAEAAVAVGLALRSTDPGVGGAE